MMSQFPAGWALMKPQQTIAPEAFEVMWSQGLLIPTLKRDGNRAHIITAGENTRIYSRNGTLDWTDRLGHIARHWAKAPEGYLVDVEVHTSEEGTHSFQNAMNVHPERILWSAFDLLRLDGSLTAQPWKRRRQKLASLEQVIGPGDHWGGGVFFDLPAKTSYEKVLERIKEEGCEGVVVWDPHAPHALNTNGNTKRGRCWKIKPIVTEDLVVTGVNPCADRTLGCGSLKLARMAAKGGPLEAIKAPVGSFDIAFDRRAALSTPTPFVVEVSHFGEDDNGNLTFAKVLRTRPDLHEDLAIGAEKRISCQ